VNPFKQKFRDELDRQITELIATEPRILIRDLAQRLEVAEYQIHISLRRQGIRRWHIAGRPRKQVS
jgi:hypothetical protein